MAAEYYRADRHGRPSDGCGARRRGRTGSERHGRRTDEQQRCRPDGARARADHEHGPNGFDLHALSGNLCRCTGYRPIRDAAYALGAPDADDPL